MPTASPKPERAAWRGGGTRQSHRSRPQVALAVAAARSAPALPDRKAVARLRAGFTLLELLAVVAVIGILAALIFPNIGAARNAANRTKTKVQFHQWAAAIESFRAEYGCYPAFDASGLVNGGASPTPGGDHLFHDLLSGRRRDGSAASTATAFAAGSQNRKRVAFYVFGESDFSTAESAAPHLLRDAFDNPSIAVLVDRNLDGKIDAADYASLPAVAARDGAAIRPGSAEFPASGVRAAVLFYVADPDASAGNPRFICSWK